MRPLLFLILLCVLFFTVAFMPENAPFCEADVLLSGMGLCREGAWTEETVTLPGEEDSVWKPYLAMQKEAGYEMTPYCGKNVTLLSCRIGNYPPETQMYAHIYMLDGKIIGGDIMSPALDGFMHAIGAGGKDIKMRQNVNIGHKTPFCYANVTKKSYLIW